MDAYDYDDEDRIIIAKLPGRCKLCGERFGIGAKVLWSKLYGTRCIRNDLVDDDVQCVGRFFTDDEQPIND